MIDIEEIINDKRFSISDEVISQLKTRKIKKYEIIIIPIGKIHRYYNKKVFSLYETDVFAYLTNNVNNEVKERYKLYCQINKLDNINRSEECFQRLILSFNEDYDIQKGAIIIDNFNFIIDGQHRSCILLNKYGEDYKIQTVKLHFADHGLRAYLLNPIYLTKRRISKLINGLRRHIQL